MAGSRAQQIRQVIESSITALDAGKADDAVRIIDAAIVEFPNNCKLRRHAAKNLHRIGGRFDEELASWGNCIDCFKERSQLKWFKACRTLILQRYRFTTNRELIETRNHLLAVLYAKARKYLVDTASAHRGNSDQQKTAYETSLWISQCDAFEQNTVQAFAKHLLQFPDTKTTRVYRKYVGLLFENDPEDGMSKYLDFQISVEKNFPLGSGSAMPANGSDAEKTADLWLNVARGLVHNGQIELAQNILKRIPEGTEGLKDVLTLVEKLDARLDIGTGERTPAQSLACQDEKSLVTWSPCEPSEKVIFVFTGAAGNFSFSQSFFHKLLENLGCHIVYLKDGNKEFFMRGDDWDGPAELEDQLKAVKNKLGATWSYMLGSSSGGYAAIRLGIALKVDGILSFSLPIASPEDASLPGVQMLFQNLQRKFPEEDFDLVRYCANAPEIPPTTVCFSELCVRDRAAAEKLAGFSQIELMMEKGADTHASIKKLVAQGEFFPMIERMMSGSK